jgi:hypothetical protein
MAQPRLTAQMQVDALRRWAEGAGGFGMVLKKGDMTSGQILAILLEKGDNPRLFARQMAADFIYRWTEITVTVALPEYLSRARARDPDLWIIELDVANPAQLIAQLILMD